MPDQTPRPESDSAMRMRLAAAQSGEPVPVVQVAPTIVATNGKPVDTKSVIGDQIKSAGASGVVAAVCMYFIYLMYHDTRANVPVWLKMIQGGYESIQKDYRDSLTVRDKQIDRVVGVLEKEQQANLNEYKLMGDQNKTMRDLVEEIKRQGQKK